MKVPYPLYRSAARSEPSPVPRDLVRGLGWLALAAGLLVAISIAFVHWDVDRLVAGLFYTDSDGWYLNQAWFWVLLEEYGPLPGIVFAVLALIGLLIGRIRPLARHWRRFLWLVVLTAVIGPGLMVNVMLKDHWGRPRPRETVDFGGKWAYHEFYQPGIPGKGKSFPCGHCSAGFIFLTLYFWPTDRRKFRQAGLAFGLFWGGLLSVARVSQGAHFVTDTLWSFGLMTMIVLTLQFVVINAWDFWKQLYERMSLAGKGIWSLIAACLLMILIVVFFNNRPFYQSEQSRFNLPPGITVLEIRTNYQPQSTRVVYQDRVQGLLQVDSNALGGANVDIQVRTTTVKTGDRLVMESLAEPVGFFMKLDHELVVGLPRSCQDKLQIEFTRTADPIK